MPGCITWSLSDETIGSVDVATHTTRSMPGEKYRYSRVTGNYLSFLCGVNFFLDFSLFYFILKKTCWDIGDFYFFRIMINNDND